MKKKVFALLAAAAMVLALAACGNNGSSGNSGNTGAASSTPAGGGSAASTPNTPAHAKGEFQLRIATVVSGDHSWVQMGNYMADELNKRSDGAIEVTVAPGGQLGTDEATIDDMRLGTLDMIIGGTQNAAPFVPEFQVLGIQYLFPSRDVFESLLEQDGEVFNYFQGRYDANGLGLKLLGLCNGGARDLHTKSPINSLADLNGMKMRVTSSATESMVWSTLGALPTSMAFNDIYSAMSNNTVDAFECTLSSYQSSALYEVAPYHIATGHQYTPTHVTCSEITWNKLPDEFQTLLKEVAKEACLLGSQLADQADDSLLGTLVSEQGVTVCNPDLAEFKAAVEPLYSQIAADCNGQELLDLINGLIA